MFRYTVSSRFGTVTVSASNRYGALRESYKALGLRGRTTLLEYSAVASITKLDRGKPGRKPFGWPW